MFGFVETSAISIAALVLVLGLIVTIHELGHFLTAKACGVKIDAFSLGFGKAVAKWRDKSGVEWRLGWMPLGGYVRFAGDENVASVPDQDDLTTLRNAITAREGAAAVGAYYHFKPVWQRALIAAAGPAANFILAIAIFAGVLLAFGNTYVTPRVAEVVRGSVAEQAGFKPGDVVVRADAKSLKSADELVLYTQQRAGLPIAFLVNRGGAEVSLTATPARLEVTDKVFGRHQEGRIGLKLGPASVADIHHETLGPLQALGAGAAQTWDILHTTTFYLGRLITGQVPADQIGGIVGMTKVSGEVVKSGAANAPSIPMAAVGVGVNLLRFAAFLSVSVGFMNLLPIPVLDGGHLMFYAYEAVARRPLGARVQAVGYRAGLALVVGFMLFAAWNDLLRYDVFKALGGLFS
jgi:regulator of sigma E protease